MPRFDRLELGTDKSRRGGPPKRPNIDEWHWLRQADAERRRGQYEAALRNYSRALEIDKSAIAGWVGQVQMLVLLKEAPEADLWSRKALELFPGNGELLAARAQAVCRQADLQSALGLSDASLAATGQSAYRWLVRGELMIALRQSTDRHCFDKAYQIERDWLVRLESACTYLHYRQPSRAHPLLREAVESAPDQPLAWYVRGCCESELGFAQQARASFLRCLELSPGHHLANQGLSALEKGASPFSWLPRLWRRER